MLEWAPLIENADDGVILCYDAHSEVSSRPSLCWSRMGSILQLLRCTGPQLILIQEVRQIYRDHGWPDRFDSAACAEAIRRWESSH